MEFKNMKA